jgi:AraC-like DNA-binding protein
MPSIVAVDSFAPGSQLAPFVHEVQRFQIAAPEQQGVPFLHMPTGNVSLWLCFGNVQIVSKRYGVLPRAALIGVHDQAEAYHFRGCGYLINVLFHVAGVCAFVPFPLHELTQRMLPLDLIWSPWLLQAIADLTDHPRDHFAERLMQLLAAHVYRREAVDERIMFASRVIRQRTGSLSMRELADACNLSSRQFERLYQEHVGLSPKRLARLTRFYLASRQIRVAVPSSWATFAINAGFADQSHLIHEFRRLTGYTPKAFLHARINADFLQYKPPGVE